MTCQRDLAMTFLDFEIIIIFQPSVHSFVFPFQVFNPPHFLHFFFINTFVFAHFFLCGGSAHLPLFPTSKFTRLSILYSCQKQVRDPRWGVGESSPTQASDPRTKLGDGVGGGSGDRRRRTLHFQCLHEVGQPSILVGI